MVIIVSTKASNIPILCVSTEDSNAMIFLSFFSCFFPLPLLSAKSS